MERITKIGLPLTVLAIVGAFAVVLATTSITPAAAAPPTPREGPLSAVRSFSDRAFGVVENPDELTQQLLGLLLAPSK